MKTLMAAGMIATLAGCAGWRVTETEPVSDKLFEMKTVHLLVAGEEPGAAAVVGAFRSQLMSELYRRQMFITFVKDREPGASEVRMSITLSGYRGVDAIPRFIFGCMAGKATLDATVTLTDLKSGENLGAFKVYGKSSSATCADGTTDDAIDVLAVGVAEVLKKARGRVSADRAE